MSDQPSLTDLWSQFALASQARTKPAWQKSTRLASCQPSCLVSAFGDAHGAVGSHCRPLVTSEVT